MLGSLGGCSSEPAGPGSDGLIAVQDGSSDWSGPAVSDGGSGDGPAGGDGKIPSDAAPPATYSFVVFGDNQFATESCTSGVSERLAIPKEILKLKPTMVLHVGDLVDHSQDTGAYARFQSCYDTLLAKHPLFPTMGNHDATGISNYKSYLEKQILTTNASVWGSTYKSAFGVIYGDDPTNYSTSFSNPTMKDIVPSGVSFKTFYAFKHENAYFLSFEIGTMWWTNTPKTWVEKHLKAARADPAIEHIFVIMHHPFYSTTMAEVPPNSSTDSLEPVRKHYEPLFRQHDVTMVFAGHVHLYEHFYVPDDGKPTRQSPPPKSYPHDGKAIHYVITGGGGGPLPNNCNPIPGERNEKSRDYMQTRKCGYHVTRVEVSGKQLTVSAIAVKGTASSYTTSTWDSFTVK
jgi:UDP-2,3-diacylglucosamine pyrophosphatase LpxH